MNTFVFMYRVNDKYQLGMLNDTDNIDKLLVLNDLDASAIREVINSIPVNCIFVGRNIRQSVLAPLLHDLCKSKLELPEKLKFHWIPPYKLPIDDINWLYNFGTFYELDKTNELDLSDEVRVYALDLMAKELGIELPQPHPELLEVKVMAMIYFTLIGDFNRFNKTDEVPF